jgi:hypothetical protein
MNILKILWTAVQIWQILFIISIIYIGIIYGVKTMAFGETIRTRLVEEVKENFRGMKKINIVLVTIGFILALPVYVTEIVAKKIKSKKGQ